MRKTISFFQDQQLIYLTYPPQLFSKLFPINSPFWNLFKELFSILWTKLHPFLYFHNLEFDSNYRIVQSNLIPPCCQVIESLVQEPNMIDFPQLVDSLLAL